LPPVFLSKDYVFEQRLKPSLQQVLQNMKVPNFRLIIG
jgi:hypothetical protein